MNKDRVIAFMAANARKFPRESLHSLTSSLYVLSDEKSILPPDSYFRSPTVALVFSLCLGYLGIDRFYIGDTAKGILKLVTGGGFGLWTIIDWFLIMKDCRIRNYQKLMDVVFYSESRP